MPGERRAFTSCFLVRGKDVDGRATPGHDEVLVVPPAAVLALLPAPLARIDERAAPDAALGGLRLCFLGRVGAGEIIDDGPAVAHQPGVHVGAIRKQAGRDNASIAVDHARTAGQRLIARVRLELAGGGAAAGPALPVLVRAGLVPLRRVDAFETDRDAANADRIPIDDPG